MGSRKRRESGFTLLEVMIAMAIMAVAFASILMVESSSIQNAIRTRQMIIAGMLAKKVILDTEQKIEGKTFEEIKKEEAGQFTAPYEDYRWTAIVKEVEFPNIAAGASGGGEEGSEGGEDEAANALGKLVTSYLSKAVREVTVTVFWKKGPGEMSFSASTYWVNLNNEFQLSQ